MNSPRPTPHPRLRDAAAPGAAARTPEPRARVPRLLAAGHLLVLVGVVAVAVLAVLAVLDRQTATPADPADFWLAPLRSALLVPFALGLVAVACASVLALRAIRRPPDGPRAQTAEWTWQPARPVICAAAALPLTAPLVVVGALRPGPLALFVALVAASVLLSTAGHLAALRARESAGRAETAARIRADQTIVLGALVLLTGIAVELCGATVYLLWRDHAPTGEVLLQAGAALAVALLPIPQIRAALRLRAAFRAEPVDPRARRQGLTWHAVAAASAVPATALVSTALLDTGPAGLAGSTIAVLTLVRGLLLLLVLLAAAITVAFVD